MAGLRFNIDADLTRFSQLVKRIQEVRKENKQQVVKIRNFTFTHSHIDEAPKRKSPQRGFFVIPQNRRLTHICS